MRICSNNLHRTEERAIGRKAVIEFGLGIGIILYEVQDGGILLVDKM
jgi:hypothetical protein